MESPVGRALLRLTGVSLVAVAVVGLVGPRAVNVAHRPQVVVPVTLSLVALSVLVRVPAWAKNRWLPVAVALGGGALATAVGLMTGYRYGWAETYVGLTLAFVGACSAVVQGALVGPVVARLGERTTLLLGLLCGALGMAIYGLSPTGLLFLAGVPTMAPDRVRLTPSLRLAMPKSSNLGVNLPSASRARKMFWGFRSRCSTPRSCAKATAPRIGKSTVRTRSGSIGSLESRSTSSVNPWCV